ncbi:MAG: RHS repeat-associated core domain-containing protein [Parabacteroides sp.]|nr:RHS repeat-associated core domain-containing protein [Parabacteroides sp.]
MKRIPSRVKAANKINWASYQSTGPMYVKNGNISAKYEYGPFGEVFCSVGDMARVNPFQFSTKYTDSETDLVYYGYRYYSPALGRWMSRDPIEEKGGLNLYGFVNNDPVNKWDRLGMVDPSECGIKVYREDFDMGLQDTFGDLGLEKEYYGLRSPFDISFGHEWIEVSGSQYGFWPDPKRFLGTLYSPEGKIFDAGNRPDKSTLLTQWDVECRNKGTFTYMIPGAFHPHGYIPPRNSFKTITVDAKLQMGEKGKGKTCCCADCDDLKECIAAVAEQWKQGHYYCPTTPFAQNCRDFVSDVLNKCALRKKIFTINKRICV